MPENVCIVVVGRHQGEVQKSLTLVHHPLGVRVGHRALPPLDLLVE